MFNPGVRFLLYLLLRTLVLPFTVYAVLNVFDNLSRIPLALKLGISICVGIGELSSRYFGIRWQRRLDMKRLGAQPIPVVPSTMLGLSLVKEFNHEITDGYQGTFLNRWTREAGSHIVQFDVLGDTLLFTIEPEHIKRLLATEFHNFEKGYRFRDAMQSVLGSGVFNADDDMWKFHRGMTRPFFSRERISDFELFGRHADEAIHKLKHRLGEGLPVDFQDLVSRFTMDSATEFLFGSNVKSLSAVLPYPYNSPLFNKASEHPSDKFALAFHLSQDQIAFRVRQGWMWALGELGGDITRDSMVAIREFIDPIVENALEAKQRGTSRVNGNVEKEKGDVAEGETLLSHLVNMTDDKAILRDEILNIMIAGRDTTASTLSFAAYILALHPDIMIKLRAEILSRVGPTRYPTYDDIRSMKYMRAFINEVLRLFPAVPFNVRCSKAATTFPTMRPGEKPWFVPANTNVNYSVYCMHRSEDFWGPTALEFDPERFLDERLGKYLTPNPFIFVPFNAGPRICLGQQFAYNESSFFLVRLLQSFSSIALQRDAQPPSSLPNPDLKLLGGRAAIEEISMKLTLTMSIKGGLWVKMTEADPRERDGA